MRASIYRKLSVLTLLMAGAGSAGAMSLVVKADAMAQRDELRRLQGEVAALREDARFGGTGYPELDEAAAAVAVTADNFNRLDDEENARNLYLSDRLVRIAEASGQRRYAEERHAQLVNERAELIAALERREQEAVASTAPTVAEAPAPLLLSLAEVRFETGLSELSPAAQRSLQQAAQALRDNPQATVSIEGHTDAVGSADFNRELSQRRAEAVRSYLIAQGVAPERISARGLGEEFPTASNADSLGRQLNRRAEVAIRGVA